MEANAGEYIKKNLHLKRFPRISFHCKLVPVQYREYEYGLFCENTFYCIAIQHGRSVTWVQPKNMAGCGSSSRITMVGTALNLGEKMKLYLQRLIRL